MITIPFEVQTPYGKYSDALILPDDHTLSTDEIEAMKQQRVTNWVNLITTPVDETLVQE